jgi:hypothetical protein
MMVGEVFEEAMIVGKVPSKLSDSLLLVAFKSVYSYTTFTSIIMRIIIKIRI